MPDHRVTVVVACMAGCPDEHAFASLRPAFLRLRFHANRASLLAVVRSIHPLAAILPPSDSHGLGAGPLIERIRLETPDVRTYVALGPSSSRVGLLEAIRAGGEVLRYRDSGDLHEFMNGLRSLPGLSHSELEATRALISGLQPPALAGVLHLCVQRAHESLGVGDVARAIGTSRRSLARRLHQEWWPPPLELIEWSRLIHASVLMWREAASLAALSHASGFATPDALRLAAHRRLGLSAEVPAVLSPLRVSVALHRRLAALRDTGRGGK
jgi:AraC-like DNA-binding protein